MTCPSTVGSFVPYSIAEFSDNLKVIMSINNFTLRKSVKVHNTHGTMAPTVEVQVTGYLPRQFISPSACSHDLLTESREIAVNGIIRECSPVFSFAVLCSACDHTHFLLW